MHQSELSCLSDCPKERDRYTQTPLLNYTKQLAGYLDTFNFAARIMLDSSNILRRVDTFCSAHPRAQMGSVLQAGGGRVSELGGKSMTLQGAPARAVENPTEQGTSADSSETTHSLPLPPPC